MLLIQTTDLRVKRLMMGRKGRAWLNANAPTCILPNDWNSEREPNKEPVR